MTPTWRNLARILVLVVVTCLAGTLLGPVIRGGFGYTWGYLSGIFGPLALVALGVLVLVREIRLARYRMAGEPEPAEDADVLRAAS